VTDDVFTVHTRGAYSIFAAAVFDISRHCLLPLRRTTTHLIRVCDALSDR